jgi:hypothetical protein
VEVIQKVRQTQPEKPRTYQPDIPESLGNVVMQSLAKEPAERYPSATALLADLEWVGHSTGTSA